MPVLGNRDVDGSLRNQGIWGRYWAPTQLTVSNGSLLYFDDSESTPSSSGGKMGGFVIRCVRKSKKVISDER